MLFVIIFVKMMTSNVSLFAGKRDGKILVQSSAAIGKLRNKPKDFAEEILFPQNRKLRICRGGTFVDLTRVSFPIFVHFTALFISLLLCMQYRDVSRVIIIRSWRQRRWSILAAETANGSIDFH